VKGHQLPFVHGIGDNALAAFVVSSKMNNDRGTCMCAFAPYDIPNAHAIGYGVVCNRPKIVAYRAPGSPIGAFAVESIWVPFSAAFLSRSFSGSMPIFCARISSTLSGAKLAHNRYAETIKALLNHPG
jgi:hypothetical protein